MRHTKLFVLILLIAIIFSCIKFKELATLTTSNTSNLTINSVTSGGNITNGGSADITARGVCWSTSQNPAVSGSHTSDGTGTGSFTSNITGLTPGTKYYLRAYATNSVGTAYGNELSITTTALVAPTLTTITITEVSLTSAKSGGTILSDGGDPISAKGVCWSTSANPTVDSSKSSDGAGNATFVSALTGLTSGDTYYYRAYATNSVGTGYGNEFSFTTTCTAATATTNAATGLSTNAATLNGIINGNGSSTTVTFEYGTTTSYGSTVTATPGSVTGSSNTSVSAAISSLTLNTTYHCRVDATNCGGTTNGADQIFTTGCTAATATTNAATGLITNAATLNGIINGNGSSTTVTFEYGTTTSYGSAVTATPGTITGSSNTSVSAAISSLTLNTTYHYRVDATNCGGTTNGADQIFTTGCTAATATTNAATGISTTSATLNGIINGIGSSTTVTFEYGTTTSYGSAVIATPGTVTGSSNTLVSAAISSLALNTTYHYRVKGVNCGGTTNGTDQIFTTTCVAATATTNAATGISTSAATLNGTINGNGSSTTVTFEYGTTTGYGSTISATLGTVAGSSNTSVSATISSLTSNATYHYRVKGVNCGGTSYGDDFPFTTTVTPTPPTVSTTAISGITQTTAASGGNVTSGGSSTVTSRGVCWSTTANPTTADSKTTDGSGTGSFSSSIIGLTANTIYHVRAYAVNAVGTAYGNDVSFESAHTIPTVTTTAVSNITNTTASSGGNVLLQGGENVTAKGVCWNTTGNPTITDLHTTDGTGLGSFTSSLTGLTANTTYYIIAYATNMIGTGYGNELILKTYTGTVNDIDGNVYNTVTIGTQVWIAENLKTTKYNDGSLIPNVSDVTSWDSYTSGAYCDYENTPANSTTYGRLYNWSAVAPTNSENVCPTGWHVPDGTEWDTMEEYLIVNGYNYDGSTSGNKLAKSLTSLTYWSPSFLTGAPGNTDYPTYRNKSGFTALPGGRRGGSGVPSLFSGIENVAYFWTLGSMIPTLTSGGTSTSYWPSGYFKKPGFSVRCLKD
jgi:uncharacterized protein (TIGR02145 family)